MSLPSGASPKYFYLCAFKLAPEDMALVNEKDQRIVEPGRFKITIGGCSPGARGMALGASKPAEALFAVE
jgi:beta-glucosidase